MRATLRSVDKRLNAPRAARGHEQDRDLGEDDPPEVGR